MVSGRWSCAIPFWFAVQTSTRSLKLCPLKHFDGLLAPFLASPVFADRVAGVRNKRMDMALTTTRTRDALTLAQWMTMAMVQEHAHDQFLFFGRAGQSTRLHKASKISRNRGRKKGFI